MKALPTFAVGIGLRQPHYREVFERAPALGFLEVHSENFFLDGGASMHALERARALLTERVDRVQSALKRSILIENVSAYVEFRESDMNDTALLDELARRSGCGILFDVNNLYVNAVNFGFDPIARMAELSPAAIGEMHLAGHTLADGCLIDTHGARVCSAVWALFEEACRRFGPRPTLIEWDTDLPALDVLLGEARTAASVARRAVEVSHA